MKIDRVISPLLLGGSFLFFLYFLSTSEGFYGGGDSIAHFRLAKFSWEHPKYLLDHWGKPLYTLIAMPFAQFGFKAVKLLNLIAGLLCCVLVMLIVRKLKLKWSWLAIPVILFAPVFMREFYSGLTEVVFVALLLFSFWLNLNSYRAAFLIVLSFLPFVRTEAIFIIAWLALIDLFRHRDWKVLLLGSGTMLYSLVGWITKGDALWIINDLPYVGGEHIYGSGSFSHYIELIPSTIGWAALILAGVGSAIITARFSDKNSRWLLLYVLIPTLIYVGFHSFMWYWGRVSLGLPRMLAVIVPLIGLLVVYGFNALTEVTNAKNLNLILGFGLSSIFIWNGLQRVELPVPLGMEEQVLVEAADFIQSNGLVDNKIHYYALYNEITLGLDPHNSDQCQQIVHNRANPHEEVASGSLVIWDAHFSPNEGAMPLENLKENSQFELVQKFEPEYPFNTLGDRPFEVYLFIRK